MAFRFLWCVALLSAAMAAMGAGPALTVQLPEGLAVKSAVAVSRSMKLQTNGEVDGRTITFANLLPDTPYDVAITLKDDTVLQGVDMTWYNAEPAKPDAGEADEEDREQVRKIIQDIRKFSDRSEVVLFNGNHDRATLLVYEIRDTPFHSGKPGEVIWRPEIYYFKNQHGGWERVSQQNKVLERQRFASKAAYRAATDRIRWVSELGGIRIPKGETSRTVTVPAQSLKPTTAPAGFTKPAEEKEK